MYRNERSVIFKADLVGGRARVTSDDERVQGGGWRDIKLYR